MQGEGIAPTIHEPGKPSPPCIVGAGFAPALATVALTCAHSSYSRATARDRPYNTRAWEAEPSVYCRGGACSRRGNDCPDMCTFEHFFHSLTKSFMVARGEHAGRSSKATFRRRTTAGDHKGPPIGINPGFCRGEGGWVDAPRSITLALHREVFLERRPDTVGTRGGVESGWGPCACPARSSLLHVGQPQGPTLHPLHRPCPYGPLPHASKNLPLKNHPRPYGC